MFATPGYAQEPAAPADEAHGATVAQDGAEHGGTFPPFNSESYASQLLWLAITFGLFYLFLKKVVLPRIGSILEIRRDRIAQDLDQAAMMKSEADAAVAAYEQELAEARTRANTIGQAARDAAKAEAEAERRQVEASLAGRMAEAEARIAEIKSSALADVGEIAESAVALIVQELVGAEVDRAAVAKAVQASGR